MNWHSSVRAPAPKGKAPPKGGAPHLHCRMFLGKLATAAQQTQPEKRRAEQRERCRLWDGRGGQIDREIAITRTTSDVVPPIGPAGRSSRPARALIRLDLPALMIP